MLTQDYFSEWCVASAQPRVNGVGVHIGMIFVYVKHVSLSENPGSQVKATIWNAPIWAVVLSHEMILWWILAQFACSFWEHCKTRCWFGRVGTAGCLADTLFVCTISEIYLGNMSVGHLLHLCAHMLCLSWFPQLLVLFCALGHIDSTQLSLSVEPLA